MDASEGFQTGAGERFHLIAAGDVGGDADDIRPGGSHLADSETEGGFFDVGENDVHAFGGKAVGHCASDAARAPSNDGSFAFELFHAVEDCTGSGSPSQRWSVRIGIVQKYFTLAQAESLLPAVERVIRAAIQLKQEFVDAEESMRQATRRVTSLGGANMDRGQFADDKRRRHAAAEKLGAAIEEIQKFGCQVKDLDIGLIDFPTLYHGEVVLLCWKLGEDGIHFWHRIEEGFRGRRAVDEEFMSNHRGESGK